MKRPTDTDRPHTMREPEIAGRTVVARKLRSGLVGALLYASACHPNVASRGHSAPPDGGRGAGGTGNHGAVLGGQLSQLLCAGRSGCQMETRRKVPGAPGVELIDVALPAVDPDAQAAPATGRDEPSCRGHEHWLVSGADSRSPVARRLTRDCDSQEGADEMGHADWRIDGDQLTVRYEEFQSSDRCRGLEARLRATPLRMVTETRYDGFVSDQRCRRDNVMTTDWDRSDHFGRWSTASCRVPTTAAQWNASGAVVPRFTLASPPSPLVAGTCGVLVDARGAGRWMGRAGKPAAVNVRLRAAVLNGRLLVDVEGATTGTLSVWVARGEPGDGDNGELGCAPAAARGVSSSSLELGSGKLRSQGPNAPMLSVQGRNTTGVQLVTESIAGMGRLALSYRSSDGALLATAALPRAPQARDLPPLAPVLPAEPWCQAVAGRLDSRPDNAATDPTIRLR